MQVYFHSSWSLTFLRVGQSVRAAILPPLATTFYCPKGIFHVSVHAFANIYAGARVVATRIGSELPSLPVAAATGISFVSPKNEVVVLLIDGREPASLETLFERRLHQLIGRQFLRLR
jgi:hypothetical protein